MRQITITSTILLASLVAMTATAAARPRHNVTPKCPPANEGVVAADAQAVLYEASSIVYESEEHKFVEGQEEIFGCAHGAKRSYHIGLPPYGGPGESGGVGPVALVGPIVAYDVGERAGVVSTRSVEEIWVRNLRTGKLIHRMPNGAPSEPGDIGLGDTTAIIVKSDGAVAWMVRAGEKLGGIQVRSVDKTGSHLLAASPEIAPTSLALAGSTLYWTQGGKPMSAALS
jgi:hypothetical protein